MLIWGCLILFSCFLIMIYGDEGKNTSAHCPNMKTNLGSIRKRRHLAFPHGTSTVLTSALVKAFQTHIPAGWFISLELDVNFPMPDAEFVAAHSRRKLHHRQKRDMWERIHRTLDIYNLNGHACVMRSICEAKMYLAPPGGSLVHDILRAVFTVPEFEEAFAEEIRGMYDDALDPEVCERIHDCPISLMYYILELNKVDNLK